VPDAIIRLMFGPFRCDDYCAALRTMISEYPIHGRFVRLPSFGWVALMWLRSNRWHTKGAE
jgi:hypothetical protein